MDSSKTFLCRNVSFQDDVFPAKTEPRVTTGASEPLIGPDVERGGPTYEMLDFQSDAINERESPQVMRKQERDARVLPPEDSPPSLPDSPIASPQNAGSDANDSDIQVEPEVPDTGIVDANLEESKHYSMQDIIEQKIRRAEDEGPQDVASVQSDVHAPRRSSRTRGLSDRAIANIPDVDVAPTPPPEQPGAVSHGPQAEDQASDVNEDPSQASELPQLEAIEEGGEEGQDEEIEGASYEARSRNPDEVVEAFRGDALFTNAFVQWTSLQASEGKTSIDPTPASYGPEPKTYRGAMGTCEKDKWHQACEEEIKSLNENNTWDLVPRLPGTKVVQGRWVFKRKVGSDGSISRYKARWCAKGFTQTEGLDYNDTFASVAKIKSFRILMALAAHMGMELEQLDVKTAFLYGKINETVYVEQPHGFEGDPRKICKLRGQPQLARDLAQDASECGIQSVQERLLRLCPRRRKGEAVSTGLRGRHHPGVQEQESGEECQRPSREGVSDQADRRPQVVSRDSC